MKEKIFLIIVALLIISSCGQESINEQHQQFLLNKGWKSKELIEVNTYTLDIPNEMLSGYEASGITFLRNNLGKEVTSYTYELKEKDIEGNRLISVVFEADDEIIGGYGILPNWSPGLFHLDDKERLTNEKLIK